MSMEAERGVSAGLWRRISHRWEVLAPLQNGDFVRLWLATGIWWKVLWIEQLVLGWLVLDLTDSAWLVALVGFFRSISLPFIGLLGASLTDRFKRRYLIIVFQVLSSSGVGLLALLLWYGRLEFWHITLVSFINGGLWGLDWSTRRALIPDLVGRERVVDAMVLENFMQNATRVLGPLLAGSLLAFLGNLGALLMLCVMGVATLLILAGIKTDSRAPAAPKGMDAALKRMRDGLRYAARQRRILGVLLITVAMNVWAFPFLTLLPVFARDVLQQGPMGLGLLGAAHGTGAFLGLGVVHWGRRKWTNELIFTATSVFSCLGLVGFAFSHSFILSVSLLFASGIGQAGFSIMQSAIILVEASDEMRGRVMGTLVLAIGGGPLGRLQSGAMAEIWGAPLAVGSMAAFAGVTTLAVGLLLAGFILPMIRSDVRRDSESHIRQDGERGG